MSECLFYGEKACSIRPTGMFIYKGKKVDERHTFRGKTIYKLLIRV